MVIHKLEHIGLMVKDVDVSVQFYTELMQMTLVNRVKLPDGVELAFLSFPGANDIQLELIGRGHDGLAEEGIVHHIAFTVSDIEAEIARLQAANVQMLDVVPREISALHGARIAFFVGPDGEHLELFQPA